jgi:hypothetical protein
MVKKRKIKQRKTSPKKRLIHRKVIKQSPIKEKSVERTLVENFVELQKVMVNLSMKFDKLTNQISKLLNLFETSAKTLAKKEFNLEQGSKGDKKIIEKLDTLSEQNKIIARGLTLMHEGGKATPPTGEFPQPGLSQPAQLQNLQVPKPNQNIGGYQKSISSSQQSQPLQKFTKLPKS